MVDSISLPDTINVGEYLTIEFFGTIGPDGCFSFSHFKTVFSQSKIAIEVWGKNSGESACSDVMVYLDGTTLQIEKMETGTYDVEILQPDGSVLNKLVVVT